MFKDKTQSKGEKFKLSASAAMSFWLVLALSSLLIVVTIVNRSNVERLEMEQLIMEKSVKINEVVSKLLYKTEALAALVVQGNGEMDNFERVAATIVDDPSILNVLIAPDGVVSDVYPQQGNEAVIGFNFFGDGDGNKEAMMAKDSGSLVFGGPFNLVQGGQALVGRLPVYVNSSDGDKEFWGLVSVTLKYPQALDGAALASLESQGYTYEIWRINPDDGEKQIISAGQERRKQNLRYVERHIPMLNADWYFRIAPVRSWYQYANNWLLILAGLFISLMLAYVVQNNHDLRNMKAEVEYLAQTDPLTGVCNRRYFMDNAPRFAEECLKNKTNCFVVIFDIDNFKKINDTYGHLIGDEVLKEVATRAKSMIRPGDLFARYGGEEFIIMVSGIGESEVVSLADRIRFGICGKPCSDFGADVSVSASFGVAPFLRGADIGEAIGLADKAMYKAKEEGRNKVVSAW